MRKGVGLEMDKNLFVELFKLMEGYVADASSPMRVIAGDFVARNQKKYDKHKERHDEEIRFMPREAFVRVTGDPRDYAVLRARLKSDGKREYWLTSVTNITDSRLTKLPIQYKVSAKSLVHAGNLSANLINELNRFSRLPKKV